MGIGVDPGIHFGVLDLLRPASGSGSVFGIHNTDQIFVGIFGKPSDDFRYRVLESRSEPTPAPPSNLALLKVPPSPPPTLLDCARGTLSCSLTTSSQFNSTFFWPVNPAKSVGSSLLVYTESPDGGSKIGPQRVSGSRFPPSIFSLNRGLPAYRRALLVGVFPTSLTPFNSTPCLFMHDFFPPKPESSVYPPFLELRAQSLQRGKKTFEASPASFPIPAQLFWISFACCAVVLR
ncbi:uncharacterized protein BT62DRAFT_1010309 [Guyanagaster necrorhizus]|uniref:Uncharacterized protein n=1 Tax=Guyanagaster necrorhizus TaxID=856835 RepID=A0A9P7VKS5_9AGAR|nr:uncharacterized protein BT62DRAFT_1010309 [Guyanagaster necrorhizus MCA 3950]KAG7442388.1 hypothetical protein BT62DRAFT_1010309 [Guyanagaster necrorhizus MCA 3950]